MSMWLLSQSCCNSSLGLQAVMPVDHAPVIGVGIMPDSSMYV